MVGIARKERERERVSYGRYSKEGEGESVRAMVGIARKERERERVTYGRYSKIGKEEKESELW